MHCSDPDAATTAGSSRLEGALVSSGESHGGVGLAAGHQSVSASVQAMTAAKCRQVVLAVGRCHPYVFGASRDVIVSSSPRFALWTDAALELP